MAQAGTGRLRTGETAVVAVSAVLVLVFVVLLLMRMAGPGEAAASASTAPEEPAPATPSPTAAPVGEDLSGVDFDFAAPSGNIACAIGAERALCGIASFDFAERIPAAEVAACPGTVGHFVEVTAEGASLVCDTSGQDLTIDATGIATLDYGRQQSKNGFTCDSTRDGMSCVHDETGYSFSVRRAGYTLS
ncbi:hypothetical protein [Georgenia sp. SYP-B2076]|uniref:hypothetical protein n=1 Tax=Georgenia sp. SYP-B2076 TaxID=2495881 RepID=UPI000F8E91A0|nr:hypothetical protein [Georgenia sp. SYP-B2076]